MSEPFFKILSRDKKTKARTGEINTVHGKILTPAFVPVGTQVAVKSLTPQDLLSLGVDLFIVNTYHAYLRPGVSIINKFGGLHKFMNWNRPLITDSGGFQIFSLGSKKYLRPVKQNEEEHNYESRLVKIDNDGVTFTSHWDGGKHLFTPEKSMEIQHNLGADLIIALDECTPYPSTREYAEQVLLRTHEWARRCLIYHRKQQMQEIKIKNQKLYGVIQGSVLEDLRKKSADFISKQDFDGIAIGGVSVGETKLEMQHVLDWVMPQLPENKPRHLLGVGELDDVFEIVERGVDTFDCVQPTRLARMGHVFSNSNSLTQDSKFTIDITKKIFKIDSLPIDKGCFCYTCKNFSRAYIHHLFHVRELLAYRLATIHNLDFVLRLVNQIRKQICNGTFLQFKQKFLKIYKITY